MEGPETIPSRELTLWGRTHEIQNHSSPRKGITSLDKSAQGKKHKESLLMEGMRCTNPGIQKKN